MATISNLIAAVVETGKARDDAQQVVWAADLDISDKRRILQAAVADYHDALSEHRSAVLRLDAVGRVVIVVTNYFVYQAKPWPHWTGSEWVASFTLQMMGHIER